MSQCITARLARNGLSRHRSSSSFHAHQCCNVHPLASFRHHRVARPSFRVCAASEKEDSGEVRRFNVMGMEVIESDNSLPEPQADFWTGEKMEGVNTMMKAYIPLIFVAALLCGGLAARFFNDGASVYIRPATSDEALPETFYETPEGFVPAEENPLFK